MPSTTKGYLILSLISATLLFCFPFYYIVGVTLCFLSLSIAGYRRQSLASDMSHQRFGIHELAWLLVFSSSPLLTLHLFLELAAQLINALTEGLGIEQRHITIFLGLELMGVALLLEKKLNIYTVKPVSSLLICRWLNTSSIPLMSRAWKKVGR